jgi:hypothetical protein
MLASLWTPRKVILTAHRPTQDNFPALIRIVTVIFPHWTQGNGIVISIKIVRDSALSPTLRVAPAWKFLSRLQTKVWT